MKGEQKSTPDILIFVIAIILMGIGLTMIYSASAVQSGFHYLLRQLQWSVVGIVGMIFFMNFDYHRYRKFAGLLIIISVVTLLLVLVPGVGIVVNGSRRWLGIGTFRFQPSDIAKFALVIYIAHYLALRAEKMRTQLKSLVVPLAVMCVVCVLVLIEDLGTAVTMAGTVFIMLFTIGVPVWALGSLGLLALPGIIYFIFSPEYEYRRNRILSFLNPFADPLGTGYHIIQSLYALGSGGLFGMGLGQSRQKYYYLPEPKPTVIKSDQRI